MSRTLEARLAATDTDFGSCWKPKEGESLIATLKFYSTGQGAFGPVRTVILEKDNGERISIWLSAEVLRAKFEELQPKPGEKVAIRYDGKHPSKGYHRYTMLVDRPEEEQSFAPLGGERDGEPLASDEEPFGSQYPPGCAAATMQRPPARSNGRPLDVVPRGRR